MLFNKMKEPGFLKEDSDGCSDRLEQLKQLEPRLNKEGQARRCQ